MKKVTRLLNRNNKNKKCPIVTQYNMFDKTTKIDTIPPTDNQLNKKKKETVPTVHKTITKSKAHKLQLQTKSQLPADVNINYASLNRVRKQRQRKRHMLYALCCCCCCYKPHKRKGFWKPIRTKTKSRWQLSKFCCKRQRHELDDDDDIDGKFAAYICEMKEREAAQLETAPSLESTPNLECLVVVETNANSSIETLLPTQDTETKVIRRKETIGKFRIWTWDDSLRSNSDRFLETLEQDTALYQTTVVRGIQA